MYRCNIQYVVNSVKLAWTGTGQGGYWCLAKWYLGSAHLLLPAHFPIFVRNWESSWKRSQPSPLQTGLLLPLHVCVSLSVWFYVSNTTCSHHNTRTNKVFAQTILSQLKECMWFSPHSIGFHWISAAGEDSPWPAWTPPERSLSSTSCLPH